MMSREGQPSNPRLQRTRMRAPLSRQPLGGPDADGGVREPREVLLPPAVAC